MTMELTIGLLAASAALLGYSIWKVHRPRERDLSRPRLILDWHYVMFPSILSTGLLALHAIKLAFGR